ncbi:MAG: hypothetical protein H7232_00590 [Aeromicrobium sp.]|nr:hypothetical protein [Burkholderiales bacterium]
MTPERLAAAEKFSIDLNRLANGVEVVASNRNRAAGASFSIAMDHHHAIFFLLKHTFHSSSLALSRCLFEAYLRGLWLKHCATEGQVEDFIKGGEPPKTMVAEIEATPAFAEGALSRIKKTHWSAMCAFTHTGGLHLQRWQTPDAVEPNFDVGELEECLNMAELFGAMSTLELVQMSKAENNGSSVLELVKTRWP